MRVITLVVMTVLFFPACGEQKMDVKDTVFAPQLEAQEKARAVQDTLKQAEQKKREASESSDSSSQAGY